jgi:hypothetical protein
MFVGDENVSRVHFVINYEVGKFFITDLGSTNGTVVNGEKISGRVQLKSGDRVRAGKFGLTFAVSKAFWEAGHIRTSQMKKKRPDQPVPPNLTKTKDQSITRAQRQALEAAILVNEVVGAPATIAPTAADAMSRENRPAEVRAVELAAAEAELRLLKEQAIEIGKKIVECQRRIANLKGDST